MGKELLELSRARGKLNPTAASAGQSSWTFPRQPHLLRASPAKLSRKPGGQPQISPSLSPHIQFTCQLQAILLPKYVLSLHCHCFTLHTLVRYINFLIAPAPTPALSEDTGQNQTQFLLYSHSTLKTEFQQRLWVRTEDSPPQCK